MGKEVIFKSIPCQDVFTLENQNGKIRNIQEQDIRNYLEEMFTSADQFVTLTSPDVQNQVRYVQACVHEGEVEVELGVEENGIRLYYKMCSEEECCRIFLDFYHDRLIPNMEEYQLVEF